MDIRCPYLFVIVVNPHLRIFFPLLFRKSRREEERETSI
jgi:hypothetical protein